MVSTILNTNNVNVDSITFSNPKTLDNGCKMIFVNHDSSPMVMQIPEMVAPFGIKKWENMNGGIDKYNLDLAFRDIDKNPAMQAFHDKLVAIDNKFIDAGILNSMAWLKKREVREVIEALYTPLVKVSKDKNGEPNNKYPPSIKLQVPYNAIEKKFDFPVYDKSRTEIDLNTVDLTGASVTAIIQFNGVWIASGKFGCTMKIVQLRVELKGGAIKGYAFVDDDDAL
jgi:hypothetical protein